MSDTSGRGPAESKQVQHEAARSRVTHHGPTADRYRTALECYVEAVTAENAAADDSVTTFPPRTVADVMTREVVSAHEGAVFKEIADALARNRISGIPVIDDRRHVIGVVTSSDLLARLGGSTGGPPRGRRVGGRTEARRKQHAMTATELMTAPAITVTPATSIADAARKSAKLRVRTLPVVDSAGELVGVVTRGDLIRQFLRPDAEILRDVERDVLRRAVVAGRQGVRVEVSEGVVTLTGEVDTVLTARRLVIDAHAIPGVVDVIDHLGHRTSENLLPS